MKSLPNRIVTLLRIFVLPLFLAFLGQGASAATCPSALVTQDSTFVGGSSVSFAINADAAAKTCGSYGLPSSGHVIEVRVDPSQMMFNDPGQIVIFVTPYGSASGLTAVCNGSNLASHASAAGRVYFTIYTDHSLIINCSTTYSNPTGIDVFHGFTINFDYGASEASITSSSVTTGWFEAVAPTVALAGTLGSGPNTITATFSEDVTGFVAGDLSLSNATIANFTTVSPSEYTFDITPIGSGALSVQVPAGILEDLAFNANTASNTISGVGNSAPVAVAGVGQVVASGAVVALDGSGSSDPDGTTLTYSWAAPAGVTLSSSTAASPSFTAPTLAVGAADVVLPFTLTVSDGSLSAQSTVQVTVRSGVSVTLSGMPASIAGPASFPLTITFSRAVTGFAAADIVVTGGTVGSLSGGGTTYTAQISATGSGNLSASVPANVAADGNNIQNLASSAQVAVNTVAAVTSKEIAHFMQTRTNALLSNQPDLAGFLRGDNGQFNAEVSRGGGMVAFESGHNAPIWARVNANWSTDLAAQSQYVFAAVGGHSKLSNNLLIGGMLQFDHLREVNGVATTQGNGWLIGPYFAAKLEGQPLYFEGSLLYGQTANTVSPLGTYTDAFTTERWLATLGVSGVIERGNLTVLPFLDAKYTSDAQAAYIDGLANPIAAQTIGLAQVSAGLDLEVAINAATTLKAGASGTWSHSSGSAIAAGYEGGRARVSLGVAHKFGTCSGLELSSFYDGIGAADFESYGAELKWEVCF